MEQTLKLYNTATRNIEAFEPQNHPTVTMYNCGPTVYNYAHIGNLRPYVFADVLRRTLELGGYSVKQIINITDVGHLVGDGDEGEDKMTAALKREGKPLTKEAMREVGDFYTEKFKEDLKTLNILPATEYPKASDNIAEDIELVETLTQKGFTYPTGDGIYFDTSKFPTYPDFAKLDVEGMRPGERIDTGEKKNPTDFALWKFNDELGYEAQFGKGFPGWHVECSAMIKKYLGHPIDIHTGGVDHIPVHHTNEIAQSESAYGTPFVKTWMHCAHMTVDGQKMSKSLGNTYTLKDLQERGISSLAFRYWLLTANYRTQVNFTWEALQSASESYKNLQKRIYYAKNAEPTAFLSVGGNFEHASNDLNTPALIAHIWTITQGQSYLPQTVIEKIERADKILGLKLLDYAPREIALTPELETLLNARRIAREEKNYAESDRLREEIHQLGYDVKDTPDGPVLTPLS